MHWPDFVLRSLTLTSTLLPTLEKWGRWILKLRKRRKPGRRRRRTGAHSRRKARGGITRRRR